MLQGIAQRNGRKKGDNVPTMYTWRHWPRTCSIYNVCIYNRWFAVCPRIKLIIRFRSTAELNCKYKWNLDAQSFIRYTDQTDLIRFKYLLW